MSRIPKKILFSLVVSYCLILGAAGLNATETIPTATFYVATSGSDTNPGTRAWPFATIERARNAIRELKRTGGYPSGGVTVIIRGGVYPRRTSFELNREDSGNPGTPVIYQAADHEKVVLFGGTHLKRDAFVPVTKQAVLQRVISEDARQRLLQCDLKAQGILDYGELSRHGFGAPAALRKKAPAMLYVGGKRMTLARWPNPDQHFPKMLWKDDNWRKGVVARSGIVDPGPGSKNPDYLKRGGTFRYDFDRPERWTAAEEIWLDGVFTSSWEWSYNRVAHINLENKEITLRFGESSSIKNEYSGNFFFAENLLEEIDQPGEYYIDRSCGILYFLPERGFQNGADVHLSALVPTMIQIRDASDIMFRDLVLDTGRGSAIEISRGSQIRVEHCELVNFAGSGVLLNGTSNTLSACHLHDLGDNCVVVSGGDFKTLTPARNRVQGCEFDHWGWYQRVYSSAVNLSGVGQSVSNNLIHHCPHGAILVYGNDHVIERNEIHNIDEEFIDLGAIYINVGERPLERGWVIRNNYIHDISTTKETPINTNGIYFDHGSQGGLVEGNIFYKIGCSDRRWSSAAVMNTTSLFSIVRNNVFVDCPVVMKSAVILSLSDYLNSRYKNYSFGKYFSGFDLSKMPHLNRYPELAPFLPGASPPKPGQFWKRFEGNLIWNPVVQRETADGIQVKREKRADMLTPPVDPLISVNNWVAEENPGFLHADNGDFTLKPSAEVFHRIKGFPLIRFKSIGLLDKAGPRYQQ